MSRIRQVWKGFMTVSFIAIFLFNYVNSTMFWHGHLVGESLIVHSHIYGKTHQTGSAACGHTSAEILLLSIVNQTVPLEKAVPAIHFQPLRPLVALFLDTPALPLQTTDLPHASLRGPPMLDR